jgi:hypothetical protein
MDWKEKTQYERITERWSEKDTVYDRLNTSRETICDFFRPDLGVDFDEEADMLMLGGDIYEGSAPWVARTASTAFQGQTVSKKLDWFQYQFSDLRLAGIDELDEFAQDAKDHMAAVYQRGNYYDVQPQFTLDGWTIGSPLTFLEEDPETGHVMSLPVHFKTYRIFYDRYNRSEGVIIKDQWTAKKCFDKFCPGKDIQKRLQDAEKKFTKALFDAISQGRMDERFWIWRAVFKKGDPIWGSEFKAPLGGKNWYDVYFEDTTLKEKQDDPLLATGYYSKPFVHWDFEKKTWESASRTAAFYAIYDTLSNNQVQKNFLENLQLKTRPGMAALRAMEGRLDLNPEGLTLMDPTEWQYKPQPIEQVGDLRLDIETMDRFRDSLSRHFHLELFRMFTDLAQQKNQEFRVLQLAEMAGERISQLLPTIETHENFLAQSDERVRSIERESGRGPFNRLEMENVLDVIMWITGEEPDPKQDPISPEFIGTLRQAQQRQQKLAPIAQGVGVLAELGQASATFAEWSRASTSARRLWRRWASRRSSSPRKRTTTSRNRPNSRRRSSSGSSTTQSKL